MPSSSSPWVSSSALHCVREGVPIVAPPLARGTKLQLSHASHAYTYTEIIWDFHFVFLSFVNIAHCCYAIMLYKYMYTTNDVDITMIFY